jgi:hypothetical protein
VTTVRRGVVATASALALLVLPAPAETADRYDGEHDCNYGEDQHAWNITAPGMEGIGVP